MNMFDIDSSVINPDVLNDTVLRKVQAKGIPQEDSEADFYSAGSVSNASKARQLRAQLNCVYENLQKMNVTWEIHEDIITSNRPVIGKMIVFCKRVVRKLTRWLVRPYVAQVTNFNAAVTLTICDMIKLQEQLVSLEEGREQ